MAASNRNRLLPISAIFVPKSGRPDFGCRASILRDGRPSKSALADFDALVAEVGQARLRWAASSERVKESPEGVARPQNVEYSTPKWGSRESKFPPGDLCRNVILPRHPKFDSFSRSQDEGPWGPILFARADWFHGIDPLERKKVIFSIRRRRKIRRELIHWEIRLFDAAGLGCGQVGGDHDRENEGQTRDFFQTACRGRKDRCGQDRSQADQKDFRNCRQRHRPCGCFRRPSWRRRLRGKAPSRCSKVQEQDGPARRRAEPGKDTGRP